MFIYSRLPTTLLLIASIGISTATLAASPSAPSPDLGTPISPAQAATWNNDIFPNGRGLPSGSGSTTEGQALYQQHCQSCHGPGGIGLNAPALAGAEEPLDSDWPDQTIGSYWPYASTLFDFIRRAKPMSQPGSFDADQIYALSAYLLALNGLLDENIDTLDADRLRVLQMPNRDGFIGVDATTP